MKLVISIVIFSLCSFSALAKNDVEAGRAKSASCVACHGAQGKVSVPMYPNLAGQNAMYLEQSLKAYKKRRADRWASWSHAGICYAFNR